MTDTDQIALGRWVDHMRSQFKYMSDELIIEMRDYYKRLCIEGLDDELTDNFDFISSRAAYRLHKREALHRASKKAVGCEGTA